MTAVFAATPADAQHQVLKGHIPHAVAESRLLHHLPPATQLKLAIGLPLRNQAELDSLLAEISDSSGASYKHFLTPAQFAAQFGPTKQDYQVLIAFAEHNGLTITSTYPNRMVLSVAGTVEDVEKAFNVKMMVYQHPVRGQFFAPDREPSLDIAMNTLDISGLDNFNPPHPMDLKKQAFSERKAYVTGSGPGGYFIGTDFRAAYAPGVTLKGSSQTVGLLEFDGFFSGDVQRNFSAASLPPVPVQTVLLDGFNGSAGSDNVEVILDIMMASYMAPGLSKVMVYEGEVPNDILNRMATDNLAQQLSSSWGFSGVNATTEQIYKEFIAQGQSMLQAAGDDGAYKNGVMSPSDDPSLTIVGGTSLKTMGAGGSWQSETTWPDGGGGISTVYPIPSYQQGISMAASGGSLKMRNIPDVALTADIQMFLICNNGQEISVGGTSAAAPLWAGFIALANQQAATVAGPRVGFLNPTLYTLGSSSHYSADFNDIRTGSNGYPAVAGYDLATGWGSPAGQPLIYDLTGTSGAPSFTLSSSASYLPIVPGSTGSAALTVNALNKFSSSVTLSVTGMPTGVTAVFTPSTTTKSSTLALSVTASVPAGTYPLTVTGVSGSLSSTATISLSIVVPGFTLSSSATAVSVLQTGASSIATAINVSGQNGFSGTVALSATGLPAGVTAIFSATSATKSSTLTFKAGTLTPAGSYPITIKGTSGSLSSSTAVQLTVLAENFSLAASPASLTLPQSSSVSSTVTVTGLNGFSGAASLKVAGVPAGVTAAFSASSTSSTSSLIFTASSLAAAGTYPVVVTGTSGSLQSTATVTINVTAPNFALSFLPGTLALPRGFSSQGIATISAQINIKAPVTLAASGLPAGVTASFATLSAAGTSLATFTASPTAAAGTFPITVTAVSGALTKTVQFNLNVFAPSVGSSMVNLSPAYNVNALVTDGLPFPGSGLDGGLNGSSTAYSAKLVGVQQAISGTLFYFGPANALDAVSGKTIALPAGKYSSIQLLGTGVNGSQLAQIVKVTYTDGTSTTFTQNFSDWFTPQNFTGETKALTMPYRDNGAGQQDNRTFFLYKYALPLNSTKTVASMTLPTNRNVVILAVSLLSAAPSVK